VDIAPGERDEHLAARLEVRVVSLRRVQERGGVEMAVVARKKP
jgi:hypothetical protein